MWGIWVNTGRKEVLIMNKKKPVIKSIGLIVEDLSDFDSLKSLISRIAGKSNIPFKKAIGNGCGKIRRKAVSYCQNLSRKGCDLIILVHDLDRNNHVELQKELNSLIIKSPAKYNFVCIPIEEIEGWFLSDPEGIKESLGLVRVPSIKGNPELIASPKEKLEAYVYSCSNKSKIYLNTKHNSLLADNLCLNKMKNKSSSFSLLYDHILNFDFK